MMLSPGVLKYLRSARSATWPDALATAWRAARTAECLRHGYLGRRHRVLPRRVAGRRQGAWFVTFVTGEGQEDLVERRPSQADLVDADGGVLEAADDGRQQRPDRPAPAR